MFRYALLLGFGLPLLTAPVGALAAPTFSAQTIVGDLATASSKTEVSSKKHSHKAHKAHKASHKHHKIKKNKAY